MFCQWEGSKTRLSSRPIRGCLANVSWSQVVLQWWVYSRLIHYSFYCTYRPRHLTWVSQLYVKWFGIKERSVRATWATRLWVTPLPSKINAKKIENEQVCFQTRNFIWGDLKPQKWIPGLILILLDPHNLSVHHILPFSDLTKMAVAIGKYGNCWQTDCESSFFFF